MHVSFVTEITPQFTFKFTGDNWWWILIGDDRNLSMHRQGLMRFKNSFSLLSWKVKSFFSHFFCKIFISVFLIWTAKNNFFPFFVKSTYHDTLTALNTSSWKVFWSKGDSSHFENSPSFQISWICSDVFQINEKFIHNCLPCLLAEMAKVATSVARPRKCYINRLEQFI